MRVINIMNEYEKQLKLMKNQRREEKIKQRANN